jgi:hypothetical protein
MNTLWNSLYICSVIILSVARLTLQQRVCVCNVWRVGLSEINKRKGRWRMSNREECIRKDIHSEAPHFPGVELHDGDRKWTLSTGIELTPIWAALTDKEKGRENKRRVEEMECVVRENEGAQAVLAAPSGKEMLDGG